MRRVGELVKLEPEFRALGVEVIAVSRDDAERAQRTATEWQLAQFSEPGVFLVRADGTLYWSAIQTMPFARPHFRELLSAVDVVISKDYPARGEVP